MSSSEKLEKTLNSREKTGREKGETESWRAGEPRASAREREEKEGKARGAWLHLHFHHYAATYEGSHTTSTPSYEQGKSDIRIVLC